MTRVSADDISDANDSAAIWGINMSAAADDLQLVGKTVNQSIWNATAQRGWADAFI